MASARTSLVIFFPSRPLVGSPYHPFHQEAIREILHEHLRAEPGIIDGYEISDSGGCWYDGQTWHTDVNWVVRTYMTVDFAGQVSIPTSPQARYVARLAEMSCVQMGHAEFFAILHNNRTLTGNHEGIRIGPGGQLVPYKDILVTQPHNP